MPDKQDIDIAPGNLEQESDEYSTLGESGDIHISVERGAAINDEAKSIDEQSISATERKSPIPKWIGLVVILILTSFYAFVLYRTSWLSDDIYITLRTIDNFVNGFGLRWNVAERVQAYTHPLWMFLILPFYAVTRDHYYTTTFVSIGVSLITFVLALTLWQRERLKAFVFGAILIFSRPFIEYSTSGLENPLSHLLVLLFFYVYLDEEMARFKKAFFLSFISSLIILNRMDLLLVVFPSMLLFFLKNRSWKILGTMALGVSPFVLWEFFSIIYYGAFFPNTAYAKLNIGLDLFDKLGRGLTYYMASLQVDYVTIPFCLLAAFLALFFRKKQLYTMVAGSFAYLLYIIWMGGDFMIGRFFTVPIFLSAFVVSSVVVDNFRVIGAVFVLTVVCILGSVTHEPPYTTGEEFVPEPGEKLIVALGICNERKFYYKLTGLLFALKGADVPSGRMARDGRRYRKRFAKRKGVDVQGAIGFRGFLGGPNIHIIDRNALSDPLLARLPPRTDRVNSVGHYRRRLPRGYKRSIERGANHFEDPALGKLYVAIKVVTSGPVWSSKRWRAIWKLHTGYFNETAESFRGR